MKQKTEWAKKESMFESIFSFCINKKVPQYNNDETYKYFINRSLLTAYKMNGKITEIHITQNAISITDDSIIETMPNWCPKLLEKGFYIIFPKPYHEIKALWGCLDDGYLVINGEDEHGYSYTGISKCDFKNQLFDFGNFDNTKYKNKEGYDLAKFVITFSLLLEADKTPFEKKVIHQKCSEAVFNCKTSKDVVKITVQKSFEEKQKEYALIHVKGFLRNQACGKNWEERKMIYISPFERMQKVNID